MKIAFASFALVLCFAVVGCGTLYISDRLPKEPVFEAKLAVRKHGAFLSINNRPDRYIYYPVKGKPQTDSYLFVKRRRAYLTVADMMYEFTIDRSEMKDKGVVSFKASK